MKVHESARKHGISDEEDPSRQLRLGFHTKGRLLELVVLIFDSGNELVIHSMKARPNAIDLLP